MKRIITFGLLLCIAVSCQDGPRSAEGVVEYHKPGDKDIESWYGHTFVVGGIPILPSKEISENTLKTFVGKKVRVTGHWNPGVESKLSPEEMQLQIPSDAAETGSAVTGDGLVAESIQELK